MYQEESSPMFPRRAISVDGGGMFREGMFNVSGFPSSISNYVTIGGGRPLRRVQRRRRSLDSRS